MLLSEDQIQELYEINDDPKRKEFLDDLFSFMQKRGTPINRLPIMAKSVLDLYELYNLVIARGGLVDVINKKLWQEIIKGLHLPSSITSAAFTLRTQYMKYLYPYECEKKNLSSPAELQAAIDGNRREGRRSSYGQYEAMHNQMQIPQIGRQNLPGAMQQMSPLALVTHAANNQQAAQAAAAAAAAHHRLMAPTFGQVPNLVTHELEQRMMEYLKLIQVKKEQQQNAAAAQQQQQQQQQQQALGQQHGQVAQQQQQQHQRQRSPSPEITTREALNALEMSRVALWQMYHNNTSPPASVNASPQGVGGGNAAGGNLLGVNGSEPQRSEALNLSDSPPNGIKREREDDDERDDYHHHQAPPSKRGTSLNGLNVPPAHQTPPGFPASFYLAPGIAAAAAAAANFHHANTHDSDAENEDEDHEDDHNTTVNSSHDEPLNGHHLAGHHMQHPLQLHHPHHHSLHHSSSSSSGGGGHHDKSDDSAIENSPSTSGGNGHISPVSTKKLHLSKSQSKAKDQGHEDDEGVAAGGQTSGLGAFEALNLLSGMQFRVTRNGTSANGEPQLVVNLELNGVKYSGLLIANAGANESKANASAGGLPTPKVSLSMASPLPSSATPEEASLSGRHSVEDNNNNEDLMETESVASDEVPHAGDEPIEKAHNSTALADTPTKSKSPLVPSSFLSAPTPTSSLAPVSGLEEPLTAS